MGGQFVQLISANVQLVDVRTIAVAGRTLRVATSTSSPDSLPLLFFNGIGASLEVLHRFADEMGEFGIGIIVFDVPGTGGSSAQSLPYRLSWLAKLANDVLDCLDVKGQVDVAGVSWGGALAQEFTHRYRWLLLSTLGPRLLDKCLLVTLAAPTDAGDGGN